MVSDSPVSQRVKKAVNGNTGVKKAVGGGTAINGKTGVNNAVGGGASQTGPPPVIIQFKKAHCPRKPLGPTLGGARGAVNAAKGTAS